MLINWLKNFITVADLRSFSNAARHTFITQTAVTQQVRALEEEIGVQLINRSTRPVELTPAGYVFYAEAKDILKRLNNAVQTTQEAAEGMSGTLRIGYPKSYEFSDMSRRLFSFHQKYPDIHLKLSRCGSDQLTFNLLNKEFDVIFNWDSTNITSETSLESIIVENITSVVALYASHPLSNRRSLERKELKHEKLFLLSPSSDGFSSIDAHYIRLYETAGYQPNIVAKISDVFSLLMMISLEQGIALIPTYCAKMLDMFCNLVSVPMISADGNEYMLAVWRKKDQNPVLQCFIKEMQSMYEIEFHST